MVSTQSSPRSMGPTSHRTRHRIVEDQTRPSVASHGELDASEWIAKVDQLAATEIAFVDHPFFRRRNAQTLVEAQRPAELARSPKVRSVGPGIAFMPELVGAALLTHPQERYLFLKLNYLRFRAEQTRRKLRPRQPNTSLIAEIDSLLSEAHAIRNHIAEANLRLLVAAGKKLCHSLDQLGDLIGEGLIPLLRAIDLFDVDRGFRFSTYATWAVRNQMLRMLRKQRALPELALTDELAGWQHIPDHHPPVRDESTPIKHQSFVTRLILTLTERERQIVRARFGLDGEPAGQSLAEISLQMGLSKERIRQVAMKALEKMRLQAETEGARFDEDEFSVP